MQEHQILPADQLHLLFQNLEEMLDIHGRFNNAMKAKKKEDPLVGDISDILLAMVSNTLYFYQPSPCVSFLVFLFEVLTETFIRQEI